MSNPKLLKQDLVYPELSYQIVGILFEVYRQLGSKYQEKYYQKAVAAELKNAKMSFIGAYVLDFLIDNKIALEIKKNDNFSYRNIEQVIAYLKACNLKLGILQILPTKVCSIKEY